MNAILCAGALALASLVLPIAADAGDAYTLSLTRGSRLMIAARINGHPVRALLDSAAEATLLNREFARQLHLGEATVVEGHGSGEAAFEASLVKGVELSALGLILPDQTVAIADLTDVGQRLLGGRIDVILGREIFDAARISIDIDARRIGILPPQRQPAGMRLDLVTEHGVETIPVRIEGGEPVRATFDLGNGSQVMIGAAFAARSALLNDGRKIGTTRGGGLGGETTRQVFTLKSLEVAGRRFSGVRAAIDAEPSASDANIGVSVLRHFLITTDYANHAVWLEPRRSRRRN